MTRILSILAATILLYACAYCIHELRTTWHPMWIARATIGLILICICAAAMANDNNDPDPI